MIKTFYNAVDFQATTEALLEAQGVEVLETLIDEDTVSTEHGDVRVIVFYGKSKTDNNPARFNRYFAAEKQIPLGSAAFKRSMEIEFELRKQQRLNLRPTTV
jgi:hypothetical protein